jgi:hypothetical protein
MLGERPEVLSSAAVARLTLPLFRNDPALQPLGMFWFLTRWRPTRVVEHSGGLPGTDAPFGRRLADAPAADQRGTTQPIWRR